MKTLEKVTLEDYARQMGVKKQTVKHWVDKGFLLATYADKKASKIKAIILEENKKVDAKKQSSSPENNKMALGLKEVDLQQIFNQIEAANYRVGYLEGVVAHLEPRVQLLTDSQNSYEKTNRQLELENVELKTKIDFLQGRLSRYEDSGWYNFLSKL